MATYAHGMYRERRKGPDMWLRVITFMGAFGWLLLLVAMMVFHEARPDPETVTSRFNKAFVETSWDYDLARYIFYLMVLGLVMSLAGLGINARRLRRKLDQVRINLVALGVISLVGIVAYLLFL
ncbi:hypothetical protein ACFL43_02820 [Thermodesulfobacteriota bacterium]